MIVPRIHAESILCDPHVTGFRGVAQTAARAIHARRKVLGLTQAAVALEVGISRERFNAIEGGQGTGMHYATAILVARALSMRTERLEGYTAHPRLSLPAAALLGTQVLGLR